MFSEEKEFEIVHVGSPIIRSHSQRIGSIAQGAKICEMLTAKMRELEGAGLAAPQIGLPYRVFVAEVRKNELFPDREETRLYQMINPEIEILSTEELREYEGCFSVPGYVGLVPRYKKLQVSWTEPDGASRVEMLEGYIARVIQHELDHLNGMLYLDRMPDMATFSTRENYMRTRMEEE